MSELLEYGRKDPKKKRRGGGGGVQRLKGGTSLVTHNDKTLV